MNCLTTVPIHQFKLKEIGDVLKENIITKYCMLKHIVMDHEGRLMSSLKNYLLKKLDIKIKLVAPYNHPSLHAEHGIKSL